MRPSTVNLSLTSPPCRSCQPGLSWPLSPAMVDYSGVAACALMLLEVELKCLACPRCLTVKQGLLHKHISRHSVSVVVFVSAIISLSLSLSLCSLCPSLSPSLALSPPLSPSHVSLFATDGDSPNDPEHSITVSARRRP